MASERYEALAFAGFLAFAKASKTESLSPIAKSYMVEV
jgi:hypothetical protein